MNTPHLVQRGCFRPGVKKEDIKGIDSLLTFDYMGSSEYEFGALPAALKEVVSYLDEYDILNTKVGPHRIWTIARKQDLKEVSETILPGVYNRTYRLKESARLEESLAEKPEDRRCNFWWDLSNLWMAAVTKEQARLVLFALGKLRERWIEEGKIPAPTPAQ